MKIITEAKYGVVQHPEHKIVGLQVDNPGEPIRIYALDPFVAVRIGRELIEIAKKNGATELVGFDQQIVLPGDQL